MEVVKESGEAEGFATRRASTAARAPAWSRSSAPACRARRDRPGQGSGFVINADGEVVTNAHVVTSGEGRAIRKAENVYVRFQDANQVPARIVGFDPSPTSHC